MNEQNSFKPFFKKHRRILKDEIEKDFKILNLNNLKNFKNDNYHIEIEDYLPINYDDLNDKNKSINLLNEKFKTFIYDDQDLDTTNINVDLNLLEESNYPKSIKINELSGLYIISKFFPKSIQESLILKTLKNYIPSEKHLNNLDLHYNIKRPLYILKSLSLDNEEKLKYNDLIIKPKDSQLVPQLKKQKNLSMFEISDKKLRWITLGGQYNWTNKKYPSFEIGSKFFPFFPNDLKNLLSLPLFNINPEAAIINFYNSNQNDILNVHQDVSELSSQDLISISLGCDCVFYAGLSKNEEPLAIILRSGDVVVMSGSARYAYHGVGKIWGGTNDLFDDGDIVGNDNELRKEARNWIRNKRVNINVRQVL